MSGQIYENVPTAWSAHVFSDGVATKLGKNQHGDASGVRGAGLVVVRPVATPYDYL